MADRLILIHGIYLNQYDGTLDGFYPGGFKWAAEHGWGGEVLNFKPISGRCFGHVEVLDHTIHIEKLGAPSSASSIDNVLVVWTAPDPSPRRGRLVVGWYRHATIYRERQYPEGDLKRARSFRPPTARKSRALSYQVVADRDDCTLLAPEQRVLWIPPRKKGDKGIPGQSPVYFPDMQEVVGPEIARRIRHFVETGEALSLAEATGRRADRPNSRHQPDPRRRKEIEDAAMAFVTDHFVELGYEVDDVSSQNRGYDLCAIMGDAVLCIEVKGRSGSDVVADFTFNEFEKIRLEERGKFEDGSFRICIVTDAVGERGGPKLHHFWFVAATPEEKQRGRHPEWRRIDGSQTLDFISREAAQGRVR